MAITRKILPSMGGKTLDVQSSPNKYIVYVDGVPDLDVKRIIKMLMKYPSPRIDGQHGVRRYINDPIKGIRILAGMLDLSKETTSEKLEEFIFKVVSLYIFGEVGKFPLEAEEEEDSTNENNALNEIGITTHDFKI
jgi:hypothetical protein